jgi:hypothetical protein
MVFDDWDLATAEADRLGLTVCGTLLPDGSPRYFLLPSSAAEDEIRSRAFEIREGRPMHRVEQFALGVALAQRGSA